MNPPSPQKERKKDYCPELKPYKIRYFTDTDSILNGVRKHENPVETDNKALPATKNTRLVLCNPISLSPKCRQTAA